MKIYLSAFVIIFMITPAKKQRDTTVAPSCLRQTVNKAKDTGTISIESMKTTMKRTQEDINFLVAKYSRKNLRYERKQ